MYMHAFAAFFSTSVVVAQFTYLLMESLCHAHPWVCLHFAK